MALSVQHSSCLALSPGLPRATFQQSSSSLNRRLAAKFLCSSDAPYVCVLMHHEGRYVAVSANKGSKLLTLPCCQITSGEIPVPTVICELQEKFGLEVPLHGVELIYCDVLESGVRVATFSAPVPPELLAALPFKSPSGEKVVLVSEADLSSPEQCAFSAYNKALFNAYRDLG